MEQMKLGNNFLPELDRNNAKGGEQNLNIPKQFKLYYYAMGFVSGVGFGTVIGLIVFK